MDRRRIRHPDILRSAGHDLRRPRGELRQGRVRLVLRLRAVPQSRLCRGLGGRRALSPVCALGADAGADRQGDRVLQPHLRPRRNGAGRPHPDRRAGFGAVPRRPGAALGDVRRGLAAVDDRHRLRDTGERAQPVSRVRPRHRTARPAHGAAASAAGDGGRRGDGSDLLHAAAGRAGPHLPALRWRLPGILFGGPDRHDPGRARRLRRGHADRTFALSGRAGDHQRHRDLPALLLHRPAVPGRRHVRGQRVAGARPFAGAPAPAHAGAGAGAADRADQRAGFRGRRRHRRGRAVRLPAAHARRVAAAARSFVDRQRFRRGDGAGRAVRAVVDRGGADGAGGGAVAAGQPRLDRDDRAAAARRGT